MNEPTEHTRGIDTLVPHPRNYNQHPPAQIERLAASLQQFGQVRPIVVHKNTIIAGHGVYLAAQHLNYQALRVTQLPDDWTDEQAMAYLVADNETRRGAEPDDAELAALLDELRPSFDLGSLGFDEAEYSALLDGLTPDLPEPGGGGDEFEPDEAAPCRVQTGDVWLIGGVHRLICGDCTDPATVDRLMQGERADMVFTDPPYNLADSDKLLAASAISDSYGVLKDSAWDKAFDPEPALRQLLRILAPDCVVYICTSQFLAGAIWGWMAQWADFYNYVVWCKPNPMPSLTGRHWTWGTELICYATRGKHAFNGVQGSHLLNWWQINRASHVSEHPTEKPVQVPCHAIEHSSNKSNLVLDPFLGSGTTIIAAHRTGRRCYGCEISPEYCEVILQRCEAEGLTVERVEQG
jgi:DNA modification methylase